MSFPVRMKHQIARCGATVCLSALLLIATQVSANPRLTAEELTAEHVVKAIDALVEAIYDRKNPTTYWEPTAGRGDGSQYQTGGHTALAVLALLHAGESYQNERLRGAVEHLKDVDLEGTYAVAVRASLWANLPPRFREHLEKDIEWLKRAYSENVGGWNYYMVPDTTVRDNSLRQFGALAWWDAAKRGVSVPRSYWESLERGYIDMQVADGGWNYRGRGDSTGSMTAAGLGALFITQDLLHSHESADLNRPSRTDAERSIEDGVQWMNDNFSPTANPNNDSYFYYYLYGVERVGLASGYKYFGGRDWYREGAAELINRFCEWDSEARHMIMHETAYGDGRRRAFRIEELAFGLMFLTRGYVAPVMNKLSDPSTDWNNRPRDVANLTFWLAEQTATHLLWQITDIHAPADEWLDAPLLYYASDKAIPWVRDARINIREFVQEQRDRAQRVLRGDESPGEPTDHVPDINQMKQMREYLDRGGLLLAVNEGSRRAFAESVEDLGRILYPHYEWETAGADYWAYTIHQDVASNRPRIRVLSNGVRDLIVIITDGDTSATFQRREHHRRRGHYDTVSNIYFYASEMNRPRPRLDSFDADRFALEGIDPAENAEVLIVRAMHEGNWNPEPAALPHVAEQLRRRGDIDLAIIDRSLSEIHLISSAPTLVVVNGIDAHEFTEQQQQAIRRYVEDGGVILFETPGGKGRFTASAEHMASRLFNVDVRSLNRNRIITGRGIAHASPLEVVEFRPYTAQIIGSGETSPRLRGLIYGGQPRLIFSRDDLSQALLNQQCWGVNGYSPESARRLLRNILLHAIDLRDGHR